MATLTSTSQCLLEIEPTDTFANHFRRRWVRNLYWNHPAFHDTTEFTHIKSHYTKSHKQINPLSITPLGPEPAILPLDVEVPAAAAALRSTNQ